MASTQRFIVSREESRRRLDRVLASRFPEHSRSYLQKLIKDGHVRLAAAPDETALRPGRTLLEGDQVRVDFPDPVPDVLVPEAIPLVVLHEDEDLLVLDKPPGLTVHPGAGARTGTLVHALLHHCHDLSGIGGVERPGIVHRLDKETSGVLVVAKHDTAHRELGRQFAAREVDKDYLAVVWGRPRQTRGVVEVPIGRDTRHRLRISPRTASPRPARTEYGVTEDLGGFAWLDVHPRTGRTHQIRVHLKEIGHPIVGDALYGGSRWAQAADPRRLEALKAFGRLALHARALAFTHPRTRLRVRFEAAIPADLAALRDALRETRPWP
ncbi:MAG: RluA family pseudouridine synthase [Candidatus Polarisedimenticolia bacterium]